MPEEQTDAFGRPLRPEPTDPFGAPVAPDSQPPRFEPPTQPTEWQPPVSAPAPAGWWQRVAAAIVDAIVVGVAGAIVGGVVAAVLDAGDEAATGIAAFAGIVATAAYYGALMARTGSRNGQTWGKQAVGIRVVRADGAPVEIGFALARELVVKMLLFGYVAIVTLYLATILNYLWPLWDAQNRALHDRIVRSRVVRV